MRKDEDDDWRFEPPPKSLRVERIRAKTRTSLREKREKRERKERERRESSASKKKRKKKDEKTRSRHSLCEEVSLKIKKKEVLFYRQTVVKLFHQHATFYPLSSSPEHTHPTTPNKYTQEE
jgi:hypothetical protein